MTTTTPERIVVTDPPNLAGDKGAMYQIREGLENAATAVMPAGLDNIPEQALDSNYDHPAFFAWDKLVNDAAESIAPQVVKMLEDAIAKRLPLTWEPER